ncbi:MFS transporter [Microbacterium sp. STN6]|uniref:MFS transporter n=1 Tax=Microbacterium sp. STN6 TaxID=2995588 RepID=UPI0022609188|nr:MFS transporter [Microbacterium sp. STN6]MCX7522013.1 MFS transporter [Microbacterium sp. STN6]
MRRRPPALAVTFVFAHAVVVQVIAFAMRPTLSYAVLDADASPALLGALSAAFAIPALILALPAGHAIDRVGERSALLVGAVFLIGAAILASASRHSLWMLFVATALLGIGHLLSVIGEQALVANTISRGTSDSRFGYYTFATAIGQTLGPLLLALPGAATATPPVRTIFTICMWAGCLLLVISFLVQSTPRMHDEPRVGILTAARTLLRIPGLVRALLASSMVLSSVDLFLAYTPALGHDRSLAAATVSAMLVARSLFSMFSRLFLGRMVTLVGRRALMVSMIVVSAISLTTFALPLSDPWLLVVSSVFGFAVGTCQPITMSWISDLAPRGTRGLAMSLRLASNRLGQTLLPGALGAFAAVAGAAGVLVTTGITLFGAAWSGAAIGATPNSEK